MKYDMTVFSPGSVKRAKAQLENSDLLKAIKTCEQGNIEIFSLQCEFGQCLAKLYQKRNFGLILSAYYRVGVIGEYTIDGLLEETIHAGDFSTFLKQAYRFDRYDGYETQIQSAIHWHIEKKLPDALAWQIKFAKLHEQKALRNPLDLQEVLIQDERAVDQVVALPCSFKLKPVVTNTDKTKLLNPLPSGDLYIISQTAKVKMEQANQAHKEMLSLLRVFLAKKEIAYSENKLIDNFCVLADGPAIFEIKSITEDNERDQVRHAISQLYEYRFLHSLFDASLWIVFSAKPFSKWFINYLLVDRTINILWIENNKICGPSAERI